MLLCGAWSREDTQVLSRGIGFQAYILKTPRDPGAQTAGPGTRSSRSATNQFRLTEA